MRALQFDPQLPAARAGLERLHEDESRPGDPHVEFLLAVGPDLEQRRVPLGVAGDQPHGVIAVGQGHQKRVVAPALDKGTGDVRRGPIRAIDGGGVLVLRPLDLRAAAVEGQQPLSRLEAVAFLRGEHVLDGDLGEPGPGDGGRRAEAEPGHRCALPGAGRTRPGSFVGRWLPTCGRRGTRYEPDQHEQGYWRPASACEVSEHEYSLPPFFVPGIVSLVLSDQRQGASMAAGEGVAAARQPYTGK